MSYTRGDRLESLSYTGESGWKVCLNPGDRLESLSYTAGSEADDVVAAVDEHHLACDP